MGDIKFGPEIFRTLPKGDSYYDTFKWDTGIISHVAPIIRPKRRMFIHFIRTDPRTGYEESAGTVVIPKDMYFNLWSHRPQSFTGFIIRSIDIETYCETQEPLMSVEIESKKLEPEIELIEEHTTELIGVPRLN